MGTSTARPVPVALVILALGCGDAPIAPPEPATEADARSLGTLLVASIAVIDRISANEPLFAGNRSQPLTFDERSELMGIWAALIDYQVALETVKNRFRGARSLEGDDLQRTFAVRYAAHVGQLGLAMALVARVTGKSVFEMALNEPAPDYGVAGGLLDRLQSWSLDSDTEDTVLAGRDRLRALYPAPDSSPDAEPFVRLAGLGVQLSDKLVDLYDRRGTKLRVREWLTEFEDLLHSLVFPVQKAVAAWMGDTRVMRKGESLISAAQLDALVADLKPGDLLVERRNWYLSNLGLPGFWPHAALYVGTEQEIAAYFDSDPEVRLAFPDGFLSRLRTLSPVRWTQYASPGADGTALRVVEAISEGVLFSTLYDSALADYLAVMRPRLTRLEKARAIERAFSHLSKPYDFDFDFATDAALVCTELVYKSYQAPAAEGASLKVPLVKVLGRLTLPANDLVKLFDQQFEQDSRQLDFVAFLEGIEGGGVALVRGAAELRASWTRSKWDFAQP